MKNNWKHPQIKSGNRGRGTRWWRQILNRKYKYGRFAHAQYKIRYITLIYGGMSDILASYRKSRSRNMMVTSDFRPEVEIWPFRACAVKIRYKTLIYGESPKFFHPIKNRGRGTRWWRQILNRWLKFGRFAHAQYKIRYITVCTVVQHCCKSRSDKYRKWHFWGSCRPETP